MVINFVTYMCICLLLSYNNLVVTDGETIVQNHIPLKGGNTNDDFEISSAGVVTTSNSLTMSTPNYNLVIYAVDGGTPSLTGSTTLTVTVTQRKHIITFYCRFRTTPSVFMALPIV